jgi:hypothetical protein
MISLPASSGRELNDACGSPAMCCGDRDPMRSRLFRDQR